MTTPANPNSQRPPLVSEALGCQALVVERQHKRVLDGLELSIRPGERVALVGANGAGKSTLLACWLGLLAPRSGCATLAGRDTRLFSAKKRACQLAWLPQQALEDEPLTAEELVVAARYRFDESTLSARQQARSVLEAVGALALLERSVTELSGGERQRVALAALLAQAAPTLLLDEPANHLDPAQQLLTYSLLARRAQDTTIVVVTHDVNLLTALAPPEQLRVLGLALGRVAFDLPWSAAELPEALAALYGTPMRAVGEGAERVILPRVGALS